MSYVCIFIVPLYGTGMKCLLLGLQVFSGSNREVEVPTNQLNMNYGIAKQQGGPGTAGPSKNGTAPLGA